MQYVSTRDTMACAQGAQAIVSGIAAGGGLYVPKAVPVLSMDVLRAMAQMDYPTRVKTVIEQWFDEFEPDALLAMCRAAYARFDTPAVAPVKAVGDVHVLELWHGPTFAFKDMALQLMPHLMTASAKLTGELRQILILVATSGDTGKAALEGFMDVPGVSICVFYPEGGVSEAQRLQMVTQKGDNTRVVAIRGNFDDAQTGVKRIFTDPECAWALDARGVVLSSANSINLARLVPQIAYYYSAYADMVASGAVKLGEPIDVCVPTGNFGNILAAEYARKMGLPIQRLICASNENNVLYDFIQTGVYDRNRAFHLTTSPSMDILISSNLERLLYELSGREDATVRKWMDALKTQGRYALTEQQHAALKAHVSAGWVDEQAAADEIRRTFENDHYLIDPHTAVAMRVARAHKSNRPMLVVSTASPYKFGRAVLGALTADTGGKDDFACCDALAQMSGQTVPEAISGLTKQTIRHRDVCDKDQMWAAIAPILEGGVR